MNRERLIIRISLVMSVIATCGILGIALYEKVLNRGHCIVGKCQPHYFSTSVVYSVSSLAMLEFIAAGMFLVGAIRYVLLSRDSSDATLRTL